MVTGGSPIGTLLQLPTDQSGVVAAGDASFWGQYIADAGEVSAGTHHGHTSWDHLTWNSARMDTAELNTFRLTFKPGSATVNNNPSLSPSLYATTYHELDPKFNALAV